MPRRVAAAAGVAIALSVWALTLVVTVTAADETVLIGDALEPAQLEVEVGSTVTWRNADDERHRVRSKDGPVRFDSEDLEPGGSFSHTFTVAGTYPYYDHRNRDDGAYAGTIVVGAAALDPDAPLPDTGAVSIVDKSFQPGSVTIAAGGTVEWSNVDGEAHTVTAADGAFDSDILADGATFSRTFDAPGSYPYFCLIHPEMRGTVTVADPAGSVPADAAEAPADDPATPAPDPDDALPDLPAAGPAVSIVGRAFDPADIEVAAGETITWTNDDSDGHTVTAVDGSFNSGVMTVGAEFSMAFESAGTFDYFCAIHPEMTGSVTVGDAAP